jgi:hypothetical protein
LWLTIEDFPFGHKDFRPDNRAGNPVDCRAVLEIGAAKGFSLSPPRTG